MSDFGICKWPKARKDYRCEWCGQTIPTGEVHFQFTGVWQGDWQNWRMHQECQESHDLNFDQDGFSPFDNDRPSKEKNATQNQVVA